VSGRPSDVDVDVLDIRGPHGRPPAWPFAKPSTGPSVGRRPPRSAGGVANRSPTGGRSGRPPGCLVVIRLRLRLRLLPPPSA
jgi:hypothetical protein